MEHKLLIVLLRVHELSRKERRSSCFKVEQDDRRSEKICSFTKERSLGMNLRSHVVGGSSVFFDQPSASSLHSLSKAEVTNFYVVRNRVNKYILSLHIQMDDAVRVQVVKAKQYLPEEVPANVFRKSTKVDKV